MGDNSEQPVNELRQRLEYLEHLIKPEDDGSDERPLNRQIDELQGIVDSLFEKYEPVTQLNSLLYKLDLWDTLDETVTGDAEKSTSNSNSAHMREASGKQKAIESVQNIEEKKLIVLNQSKLFEKVSSSTENVTKVPTDMMTTSPVKVASMKEDFLQYLDQINSVIDTTEELSVRTAQAVKYYLKNIVVSSNEMLVDCDEQLSLMEKKLQKIYEKE